MTTTHVIIGNPRPAEDWRTRNSVPREHCVVVISPGRLYRATRGLELGRLTFVAAYRDWALAEMDGWVLDEAHRTGARMVIAP